MHLNIILILLQKQLYSGERSPYGPCTFLQSMWLSLKELAGYAQQDAHEFFISALNQIHADSEGNLFLEALYDMFLILILNFPH